MSGGDDDLEDFDGPLPDDEEELGAPIDFSALARAATASVSFYERLRRRIERRQVTADFATLFWSLPGTLLRGVLAEGSNYLHPPRASHAGSPDDEEPPHG
ncbi:MAG: hypothetical protein R3F60_03255 [bacterium]